MAEITLIDGGEEGDRASKDGGGGPAVIGSRDAGGGGSDTVRSGSDTSTSDPSSSSDAAPVTSDVTRHSEVPVALSDVEGSGRVATLGRGLPTDSDVDDGGGSSMSVGAASMPVIEVLALGSCPSSSRSSSSL